MGLLSAMKRSQGKEGYTALESVSPAISPQPLMLLLPQLSLVSHVSDDKEQGNTLDARQLELVLALFRALAHPSHSQPPCELNRPTREALR